MPPVKKPKPQKMQKAATPTKAPEQSEKVVSGQLKKKLQKKPKHQQPGNERGVVFVKHLPHGFFEEQLRKYFGQFGRVTRLRLGRSKRTGGSKGFAFVEFEYPEVAKVAADTMDNYLMFQKVVKASYIPPAEQKFNYFTSTVKKVTNKAGKEIYVSSVTKKAQKSLKQQNDWTEAACQKRTDHGLNKVRKLQDKFPNLGIDFSELVVKPVKKSKTAPAATETTTKTAAKVVSTKTAGKAKKPKLEDLLDSTLNEDSDDEDYVDAASSDEEEADSDEEELPTPPPAKKSQKKKSAGLDELIKRKPGQGGVQKKKPVAPAAKQNTKKGSASSKLQLAAAKKLAQPLQKIKSKKPKK